MESQNADFKEVVGERKPRVLMVEDEEFIAELIKENLYGEVEWEDGRFVSAQQAIERLNQKKPKDPKIDLLITDLGLTDGAEAGTRVAKTFSEKYPNSNIIFVTGSPDKIDNFYTSEQKKDLKIEVVAKPFRSMEIIQKVDAVKHAINKPQQA